MPSKTAKRIRSKRVRPKIVLAKKLVSVLGPESIRSYTNEVAYNHRYDSNSPACIVEYFANKYNKEQLEERIAVATRDSKRRRILAAIEARREDRA